MTSVPIHLGAFARRLLGRCGSPWERIGTEIAQSAGASGSARAKRILCASSVGFNAAVLPVDSVVAMGLKAMGIADEIIDSPHICCRAVNPVLFQVRENQIFLAAVMLINVIEKVAIL